MNKSGRNDNLDNSCNYNAPEVPLDPSDEPLGNEFFTNPSQFPEPVEPFSVKEVNGLKPFKKWLVACMVMLVFGLIFEFGLLGQKGQEGFLCKYLPKNKVCFYLAGPPPTSALKEN